MVYLHFYKRWRWTLIKLKKFDLAIKTKWFTKIEVKINEAKWNSANQWKNKLDKMSSTKGNKKKLDLEAIHVHLTKMIVACGMAFTVVDNPFFIKFVEALNPDYKAPCRTTIATRLLEKVHCEVMDKIKAKIPKQVCFLADSWKNTSGKTQNFAIMLHNSDGSPHLIETFDCSNISENNINLADMVNIYIFINFFEKKSFLSVSSRSCRCFFTEVCYAWTDSSFKHIVDVALDSEQQVLICYCICKVAADMDCSIVEHSENSKIYIVGLVSATVGAFVRTIL